MKKIIRFTIFSVVLLIAIFGVLNIVLYSGVFGVLNPFNITSVKCDDNYQYTIQFDKVKAAKYYEIIITDAKDVEVFRKQTTKNTNTYTFDAIESSNNYKVQIIAYNKDGEKKESNNVYSFKHTESPSFVSDIKKVINDEGVLVTINGDLSSKKYSLQVLKQEVKEDNTFKDAKEIFNKVITDNVYDLESNKYSDTPCKIIMNITKDNKTIDSIELYYGVNPLKDPIVTSLSEDHVLDYTPVYLKFDGSDATEEYTVSTLSPNGSIAQTATLYTNELMIDKPVFNKVGSNTIRITAKAGDYSKTYDYVFNYDSHYLPPVYLNKDPSNITKGDKVELLTNTAGIIYYTIDGTNPINGGLIYNGPITIEENTTINAYVKEGTDISKVYKYDLKVNDKEDITVYISSSNQKNNIGVGNYTNERDEMTLIANEVAKNLKVKGINVVRNDYLISNESSLDQAKKLKANLVINLQTESSYNHSKNGISSYVYDRDSSVYGLASIINKNIASIYNGTNNGIREMYGITNSYVRKDIPSITINLGYHDNENDADWITSNRENIGKIIGEAVRSYYGFN